MNLRNFEAVSSKEVGVIELPNNHQTMICTFLSVHLCMSEELSVPLAETT